MLHHSIPHFPHSKNEKDYRTKSGGGLNDYFTSDTIQVDVEMEQGGTPEQIDQNIIRVIQSEIQSIEGINDITSIAHPNRGVIKLEVDTARFDINHIKNLVKDKIDVITNLPKDARRPRVSHVRLDTLSTYIGLCSDTASDYELYAAAEKLKTGLIENFKDIRVDFLHSPSFEIGITIPANVLMSKGLTIAELSRQIEQQNKDLYSGQIFGKENQIIIKGGTSKRTTDRLKQIPIYFGNGERLNLIDIIGSDNFRESLMENQAIMEINGRRAAVMRVEVGPDQDLIRLTNRIISFVDTQTISTDIDIVTLFNNSDSVRDSLNVISKNAVAGLFLLLLTLTLFLNWKIAFWTTTGVTFVLFGALSIVYFVGQTMNMLMMGGFLVASGLIVDDAIIVGERFFQNCKNGMTPNAAAISVTNELSLPITTMVCTSVAAFAPLLFIPGMWGELIAAFALAIICALILSLIESLAILPVHLAHHSDAESGLIRTLESCLSPLIKVADYLHPRFSYILSIFGERFIRPSLQFFIKNRYAFILLFISGIILELQFVRFGFIEVEIEPVADSENLIVELKGCFTR